MFSFGSCCFVLPWLFRLGNLGFATLPWQKPKHCCMKENGNARWDKQDYAWAIHVCFPESRNVSWRLLEVWHLFCIIVWTVQNHRLGWKLVLRSNRMMHVLPCQVFARPPHLPLMREVWIEYELKLARHVLVLFMLRSSTPIIVAHDIVICKCFRNLQGSLRISSRNLNGRLSRSSTNH